MPLKSAAGHYFTSLYASGTLTAGELACGAAEIVKDGVSRTDLQRLARAAPVKTRGSRERCRPDTRNTSRGVLRAIKASRAQRLPSPIELEVPVWSTSTQDRENCSCFTR